MNDVSAGIAMPMVNERELEMSIHERVVAPEEMRARIGWDW
jgi:hypothetical protein